MAYFQKDEMAITKAVSIKLADDIALIATMQYHTERGDRSASRYRYLARVVRISAARARITELLQDANRLGPWKWPDDPSWDGKIYTHESTNSVQAEWLRMKLKKLVDWDLGVKILNGYVKCHDEYNLRAKYDTDGYVATDGSVVSLLDKRTLITKVGQNLLKEVHLKAKRAPVQKTVVLDTLSEEPVEKKAEEKPAESPVPETPLAEVA